VDPEALWGCRIDSDRKRLIGPAVAWTGNVAAIAACDDAAHDADDGAGIDHDALAFRRTASRIAAAIADSATESELTVWRFLILSKLLSASSLNLLCLALAC
jgi:hypothetical protein